MKQLCIALIVCWLIVINGEADGRVVLNDSELLLKSDGEIIELYKSKHDGSSWLRMVLLFSRDTSGTNETRLEYSPASESTPTTLPTTPTTTVPLKRCQSGFILLGDLCYHFSSDPAAWTDAAAACHNLDGEFAHPLNAMENSLINSYVDSNYKEILDWWLGGSDGGEEGKWVWHHDGSTIGYTDWYEDEPNGSSSENCLHNVRPFEYKWNDRACYLKFYFICQKLPFTS